jgi:mono/diheme cytochrome c family protein
MKAVLRAFLLLVVVMAAVAGAAAFAIATRGLSTSVPPTSAEAWLARSMRSLATPGAVRERRNPVAASDEVLRDARAHFADHCASCHANDGSGDTSMGRRLYPRAPDMRARPTQALSDGELFSIIEHGIRLTGMPGWSTGTAEGEAASWGLVHFIRRLPTITAEELAEMEGLNPRSPQQFREEEEARRFLAGDEPTSTGNQPSPHSSHGVHR